MAKKKNNFRKGFRKNKRNKHPAYVFDRNDSKVDYIGITHSDITGGESNIPLKHNPNPNDRRKAYIRPRTEKDDYKNFGRAYNNWKFSKEDIKTVHTIIDKNKKNRK